MSGCIGSITEHSNLSDFLDFDSVSGLVDEIHTSSLLTSSLGVLSNQMSNGGLDQESLVLGDNTVAYNFAKELQNQIMDSITQINDAKKKILQLAKSHRAAELQVFVSKLDAAIRREEDIMQYQEQIIASATTGQDDVLANARYCYDSARTAKLNYEEKRNQAVSDSCYGG